MMAQRLWAESEDGTIQYVSLTDEYLNQSLEVMRNSFFVDESVSIAVELHKNAAARLELEDLSIRACRDGLSIIAIEKSTKKVVGVAINKIQVLNSDQTSYFEKFAASCKESSSKALVQFMIDADASCDLFNLCKVNCILELMFMATLREFRGRKIASTLCQASIEAAKLVKSGVNCKVSITNEPLTLEPVPQLVSAIFTSPITQKISKQLGFIVANEISYDKFSFEGKTFLERLESKALSTTIEYYVL